MKFNVQDWLNAEFLRVKRVYFPKWDRGNKWVISHEELPEYEGAQGYCDSKRKRIYITPEFRDWDVSFVPAFLIHEICHDVAAASHNRSWADRMKKASHTAINQNELAVAGFINDEVFSYTDAGVRGSYDEESVFTSTSEFLLREPEVDKKTLVGRLAKHFGVNATKLQRDFGDAIDSTYSEMDNSF